MDPAKTVGCTWVSLVQALHSLPAKRSPATCTCDRDVVLTWWHNVSMSQVIGIPAWMHDNAVFHTFECNVMMHFGVHITSVAAPCTGVVKYVKLQLWCGNRLKQLVGILNLMSWAHEVLRVRSIRGQLVRKLLTWLGPHDFNLAEVHSSNSSTSGAPQIRWQNWPQCANLGHDVAAINATNSKSFSKISQDHFGYKNILRQP